MHMWLIPKIRSIVPKVPLQLNDRNFQMTAELIACQQHIGSSPHLASSSGVETWQLAAGLEAAVILVLFAGWLHAASGTRGCDREEGESQ
jgi:hypothetical protein